MRPACGGCLFNMPARILDPIHSLNFKIFLNHFRKKIFLNINEDGTYGNMQIYEEPFMKYLKVL